MLADNNNSQMYSVDELQENFADSWESCDDENESLNPVHHAVRQNLIEQITEHLQYIPEREQVLLQLYYLQDMNMKEIGLVFGITETRVSQLHSLALKKIEKPDGIVFKIKVYLSIHSFNMLKPGGSSHYQV